MPVLWTDYGTKALLSNAFDAVPFATFKPVYGVLLNDVPPMDRTLIDFLDYPWTFTAGTFFAFVVYPSVPHTLETVGGRAVLQWGPPALELGVAEDFTCHGMIWCDGTFKVFWVDKWDTPHAYETGEVIRIIPWVTMASECPPLGGCY